jgi:hypothetical protein
VIYFLVGDRTVPSDEPFIVLRVDTNKRSGDGCEGIVESIHRTREMAERAAAELNFDGPCSHCGATDLDDAAFECPNYKAPKRACHGETP